MLEIIIILSALFASSVLGNAEDQISFEIPRGSIGTIHSSTNTNSILGTGFIVQTFTNGTKNYVLTCAHVNVRGATHFSAEGKLAPLSLVYQDLDRDLALLALDYGERREGLNLGDIARIAPGDPVIYIGWDSGKRDRSGRRDFVSSTGKVLRGKVTTSFLEFSGIGIPGYSGGPVFDRNGKVVAIMAQGFQMRGIKGGDSVLINRAFSVETLDPVFRIIELADSRAKR